MDTALHEVVLEIERTLQFREYTLGTFMDIEGAFNNVKKKAVMQALHKAGVEKAISRWIYGLLTDRIITSSWADTTLDKIANRGTPQGGVLSPLLWILVLDDLLRTLEKDGIKAVAYADDVAILVSGKDLNILSEITERAIRKTKNWAYLEGLNINPEKTEIVVFTRRYKVPTFNKPRLGGVNLQVRPQTKYLGVILDSKLSWKPNTDERVAKATKAFYTCSRLFGRKWGLKPNIMHWIYTAIIRPTLMHGVTVWWPAIEKSTYLSKLVKVQRLAALGTTGALKSTPTLALDLILNLPPIDLFAKSAALRRMIRMKGIGSLKVKHYGHSRLGGGLSANTDFMLPEISFDHGYKVYIPDRSDWEEQIEPEASKESINLYTDGSKTDYGVGAAVFSECVNIRASFRLQNDCTVFQAEIVGIHKAAVLAQALTSPGSRVNIYVDSQAALKALISNEIRSKCVFDCHKALAALGRNRKARLCWVPGHRNIPGNETADLLAKEGARLDAQLAEPIQPPISAITASLGNRMMRTATDRWNRAITCRITKEMWKSHDKKKTGRLLRLNRSQCSTIVGLMTGHCMVGEHAHRMGLITSNLCSKCSEGSVASLEHILCQCPAIAKTRGKTLGKYFYESLKDVSEVCMGRLLRFAAETEVFKVANNADTSGS